MPVGVDKKSVPSNASLGTTLTFGSLTVSSLTAYKHGVVTVLEFGMSDSTTRFIKFSATQGLEIGGTADFGTGTKVSF